MLKIAVTQSMTIQFLGPFVCLKDKHAFRPSLSRKTRAILAYLAVMERAQSRQALYTMFCQETDDPQGALRWHLSRIRRQLSPDVLIVNKETVQFDRAHAQVDVHQLTNHLDPQSLDALELQTLELALGAYQGEFLMGDSLPDAPEFEMWLLAQRTRLQHLAQRGMVRLVEGLIEANRLREGLDWAQKLLSLDPLLETAHAQLMWLYAKLGQRDAALKQFQQCRDLLERELAVEPSEEIVQLYEEILAGEMVSSHITQTTRAIVLPNPSGVTPFAGREPELARLHDLWREATRIGIAVGLVDAEAGGGKTRLITEFSNQVGKRLFLSGQCYESVSRLPYQPWLDLLESRLERTSDESLAELPAIWHDQLVDLLPMLSGRLGRNLKTYQGAASDERSLFLAVVDFLFKLPQTPPLIVFLDDLQWADEATLRLFQFMAHRLRDTPLSQPTLLLGAYRTEEADENPSLWDFVHDLHRTGPVSGLHLAPLDMRAIEELIDQQWQGNSPSGYDSERIRNTLLETTHGNPLYVTEVLQELAGMREFPDKVPIPPSLNGLVRRRLRQMSDSGRQVIEAMAVADMPTNVAVAQRISGRSEDDVFEAIDSGLRWRLLKDETGEMPGVFNFSHDIMRETVRKQLNTARRQRLHRRSAQALAEINAPAAQIAHHWREAGNTEQELRFTLLAGTQAATLYAHHEALRYFDRALSLASDPHEQAALFVKSGHSYAAISDWPAAEAAYQSALALAEQHDLPKLRADCWKGLGKVMSFWSRHEEALKWLYKAHESFRTLDHLQGQLHVLDLIALTYGRQGKLEESKQYFEDSLALATKHNDLRGRCVGHLGMAKIYHEFEDLDVVEEHLNHALELAQQLNDPWLIARTLRSVGVLHKKRREYVEAERCYFRHIEMNYDLYDLDSMMQGLINLGILYRIRELIVEAQRCFRYALYLALEIRSIRALAIVLNNYGDLLALQGDSAGAEQVFEYAVSLSRLLGVRHALSRVLFMYADSLSMLGKHEHALVISDEALAIARDTNRRLIFQQAARQNIALRYALGRLNAESALQGLRDLLERASTPVDRARILYSICQVDPNNDEARQEAASIFYDAWLQTGEGDFRVYYNDLTDENIPSKSVPPELPDFLTRRSLDHDVLMVQVQALFEELQAR